MAQSEQQSRAFGWEIPHEIWRVEPNNAELWTAGYVEENLLFMGCLYEGCSQKIADAHNAALEQAQQAGYAECLSHDNKALRQLFMNENHPTTAGERTQKSHPESAEHSTEGYQPERVEYLFGQIRLQIESLKRDYGKAIRELELQDKEIARLKGSGSSAPLSDNESRPTAVNANDNVA